MGQKFWGPKFWGIKAFVGHHFGGSKVLGNKKMYRWQILGELKFMGSANFGPKLSGRKPQMKKLLPACCHKATKDTSYFLLSFITTAKF